MSLQQRRLYRVTDGGDPDLEDLDPEARGVIAIQQHAVFVEIVSEFGESLATFQQYAAVVGLVKKCKQTRNVFDNAVLWFNDQFLFGNKSNVTFNVTPPNAMGRNPNRTILMADLLDDNRNNGTGKYNPSTGGFEVDESGVGPNEGGNPDRDGFIRADVENHTAPVFQERWGGCFIPDGFVHAIGSDDPYGVGRLANGGDFSVDGVATGFLGPVGIDNIQLVKNLIDLENNAGGTGQPCPCGIFTYVGSFFITDPNNHRWIIDEFLYPVELPLFDDDVTSCHFAILDPQKRDDPNTLDDGTAQADLDGDAEPDLGVGTDPERRTEPVVNTRCTRELERPDTYGSNAEFRETDRKGNEGLKFTTKEILLTVHVQVDPWNPDTQGFPDEAIWAYREDGRLRTGMPYSEDLATPAGKFCHDEATVAGLTRDSTTGDNTYGAYSADFYEYDDAAFRNGTIEGNLSTAPGNGSPAWSQFGRGPVGNTVECAIEYNFLIAVFFESFDNVPAVERSVNQNPVHATVSTQGEGTGENEIVRDFKEHDEGGANEGDKAWQGNSHPHNPVDKFDGADGCTGPPPEPNGVRDEEECPGVVDVKEPIPGSSTGACREGSNGVPDVSEGCGTHKHDALVLDMFFYHKAPAFVMLNPYWDHSEKAEAQNSTGVKTTGTPPPFKAIPRDDFEDPERRHKPVDRCVYDGPEPPTGGRRQAVEARRTILCDTDAVDGFHLHDGKHEI